MRRIVLALTLPIASTVIGVAPAAADTSTENSTQLDLCFTVGVPPVATRICLPI